MIGVVFTCFVFSLTSAAVGTTGHGIANSTSQTFNTTLEQQRQEIETRLDSINAYIQHDVDSMLHHSDIRNTAENIRKSLMDLKEYIDSKSEEDMVKQKMAFGKHFEVNCIWNDMKRILSSVTNRSSAESWSSLGRLQTSIGCNLTAVDMTEKFYQTLLTNGRAVIFSYIQLFPDGGLKQDDKEWDRAMNAFKQYVLEWKNMCTDQFLAKAHADFVNNNDPTALWINTKQQYPWFWNDVIAYTDLSGYAFHYYSNWINTSFWRRENGKNTYQVFGESGDKPMSWDSANMNSQLQNLEWNIRRKVHNESLVAKEIANLVMLHVRSSGFAVRNIIVVFDGLEYPIDKVLIHKESPVAQMVVRHMVVEVCCRYEVTKYYTRSYLKTYSGNFRVFVYPGNPSDQPEVTLIGHGSQLLATTYLLSFVIIYHLL